MADTRLFGHCKDRRRRHTLELRAAGTLTTQELGVGHCRTLLFGHFKDTLRQGTTVHILLPAGLEIGLVSKSVLGSGFRKSFFRVWLPCGAQAPDSGNR